MASSVTALAPLPHRARNGLLSTCGYRADGLYPVTAVRIRNTFVYTPMQGGAIHFHLPVEAAAFWVDKRPPIYEVWTACGRNFTRFATSMTAPDGFEMCDGCVLGEYRQPYVYRFFDITGRLLYVGYTIDPAQRFKQHSRSHESRRWWVHQVRYTVTAYDSEEEGRAAEKAAILAEKPLYNRNWVKRSEWLESAA